MDAISSSSSSPSKRKFDDIADPPPINPTRLRKHPTAPAAAHPLQFFVRLLSGHTHVLRADPRDTVRSIHEKIQLIAGIPLSAQRLIYLGKQLNCEQTLSECGVKNDACLHLVGRMRSTGHSQSWRLIEDIVSFLLYRFKNKKSPPSHFSSKTTVTVKSMLLEFFTMTPQNDPDMAFAHLQIFTDSSALEALVMLYTSSHKPNKDKAEEAIKHLITSWPENSRVQVTMELCRLLRTASVLGFEDPLYIHCRSSLGTMLESMEIEENKWPVGFNDVCPFLNEIGSSRLQVRLMFYSYPLTTDVNDFSTFVRLVKNVITRDKSFCGPIRFPLREKLFGPSLCFAEQAIMLHIMFFELLSLMDKWLVRIEAQVNKGDNRLLNACWKFLALLKGLNCISKLYHDCEGEFWKCLKERKRSLSYLIINSAKSDDHNWISECKKAVNFEARTQLATVFIPEVKNHFDERHTMLIDRGNLLSESFEYIRKADLKSLCSGLFMMFRKEEASGPGVLREWFLLICRAIFNPQNPLFVACPNDHRRFFPNPAYAVDPLVSKYFNFVGKVIALALMHKVQVGIMFDRIFFLQLGRHTITLEDIRDADPFLYNSCKQILEMDPEFVDQGALDLMFVHEIEKLGKRWAVELCPGGKNVAVNSKNRKQYVESLIQRRFVKETAEQVNHFAIGFAEIFGCRDIQRSFFQCLNPEDFELMIHGSENEISVDDWKAHTVYNGFNNTDAQISWFWKIVGNMTQEQKKCLLFFWTSIKYLPVEGFSGLVSRLQIYKILVPSDHLPSSHTCFYQLCFPAYPTMDAMRDRLCLVTREHVSCSFGTA